MVLPEAPSTGQHVVTDWEGHGKKSSSSTQTNAPARLVGKASPCLSVRIYHKHHVSEACLCIKAPFPRITRRRKSF